MKCPCSKAEIINLDVRAKYQQQQAHEEALTIQQKQSLPLKIRAIKFLGLDQYMINKFLFNPRHRYRYRIKNNAIQLIKSFVNSTNHLQAQQIQKLQYEIYTPPKHYQARAQIIQSGQISIPVVYFKPITFNNQPIKKCKGQQSPIVIYSHGNSSDLYDSIKFLERIIDRWQHYLRIKHQNDSQYQQMREKYALEFLAYDYTGYGASHNQKSDYMCSQKSICNDLQHLIQWIKRKQKRTIILWGFSLGSVPTVNSSTIHDVYGCIIQSPFASITNALKQPSNISSTPYQGDLFSNIGKISEVRAQKILIMHGEADQIVPAKHSEILYDRYVAVNTAKLKRQFHFLNNRQSNNLTRQNQCNQHGKQWDRFVQHTISRTFNQRTYQKLSKMIKQRICYVKVSKLSHNGIHPYLFSKYPNELQQHFLGFLQNCCNQIISLQSFQKQNMLSTKMNEQKQRKITFANTKQDKKSNIFERQYANKINEEQNIQQIVQQHGNRKYFQTFKNRHQKQRVDGILNRMLINLEDEGDDELIQLGQQETLPTQESIVKKADMFTKNKMLNYF